MLNRTSVLGGVLALVLAGCGGNGSSGGPPPATSTAPPTTVKPAPTRPAPITTNTAPVTTATPAPPSTATTTKPPVTPPAPPAPKLLASAWLPYWMGAKGVATVKDFVGRSMDEVDMFSYALNTDGTVRVLAGARDKSLIAAIHNNKGIANMCVTGHSSASVVGDPVKRKRFIDWCVKEVTDYDLDGVDLDWENLRSTDKADFNKLCEDLAKALHAKKKILSITVIAKTSPNSTWGAKHALDYRTLGRIADRFKIMTYAYSGPWGKPGPIGPVTWQEQVVKYAISEGIPKSKIYLGVAFYGYDWPANGGKVTALTSTAAGQLATKAIGGVKFHATYKEAWFEYRDSAGVLHTVWFQNAKAIEARCELVKKLGIAGMCCWSIGQETRDFWLTIEREKK